MDAPRNPTFDGSLPGSSIPTNDADYAQCDWGNVDGTCHEPDSPPTSVHTEETTSQPETPRPLDIRGPDERSFRHSGWQTKRARIREALESTPDSRSRVERFDACGSVAWVMVAAHDPNKFRVACTKCHDRFCDPCHRERTRTVTRALSETKGKAELRLLTLTLKSSAVPLGQQLSRLLRSFTAFRKKRSIAPLMHGGIAFIELTLNVGTGLWHPHLHVLFEGKYLPREVASLAWHQVTKDSYVIDIRHLRGSAAALSYVAKYAGKGIPHQVWHNASALREALDALHGRRLFNTFGTWSGLDLSRTKDDDIEWRPVRSLRDLLALAQLGDADARRILKLLERTVPYDPVQRDPQIAPPSPLPELFERPPP